MLFHTLLWQNCWMDALAIHTSALPPCLWLRYTFWKIIFVFFPPNVVSQLPWPKGLSHLYGDRASLCSEEWRWTASAWTGSCWGSSCLGAVNEAPEHYQRLEFMLLITLTWLTEDLKVLIWCTWVSISQVFNFESKGIDNWYNVLFPCHLANSCCWVSFPFGWWYPTTSDTVFST